MAHGVLLLLLEKLELSPERSLGENLQLKDFTRGQEVASLLFKLCLFIHQVYNDADLSHKVSPTLFSFLSFFFCCLFVVVGFVGLFFFNSLLF